MNTVTSCAAADKQLIPACLYVNTRTTTPLDVSTAVKAAVKALIGNGRHVM